MFLLQPHPTDTVFKGTWEHQKGAGYQGESGKRWGRDVLTTQRSGVDSFVTKRGALPESFGYSFPDEKVGVAS